MNEIVQSQIIGGQVEVYGATRKLSESITANFEERGRYAADLLVASLTETPHAPIIDGIRYEVPVSNRYTGVGVAEGEEDLVSDTVDEARTALHEFLDANAPSASKLGLKSYKTAYRLLWAQLKPSRWDDHAYKEAFNEAFVESARSANTPLVSPDAGELIIARAPKKLHALPLSGHTDSYRSGQQRHDAITADGRLITVYSSKRHYNSPVRHWLAGDVTALRQNRRGRAPGSTIASQLEDRVIDLRSRSTKA